MQKSKQCAKVLQLMDEDFTYSKALKKVLSENPKTNKTELEKELNIYI